MAFFRALVSSLIVVVGLSAPAFADDFKVPALTGPVVDAAGVLDTRAVDQIENGLRKLRGSGGSQITVLTVPSLGGLEIEQASIKVTDAWKLGGAKTDNGILLMIAPSEHRVRIEVGQGLEGSLTDAFSNRIIRDTILPEFRSGTYTRGTVLGLVEIIKHTDPNVDPNALFGAQEQPQQRIGRRSSGAGSIFKLIFFFIIMIVIFANRGGGGGRRRGISPWTAGALGYGLGGGFGGGGWGGGSGGGGGGWGGGGGGFSGGGASGGW